MRAVIATPVVVSCAVIAASGQAARSALQIVMKVEARRVAGQEVTDMARRAIDQLLPEAATLDFVTDGQSVRNTVSHPMFGFADGAVRLASPTRDTVYVLDTKNRTYYISHEVPVPPTHDVNVRQTGRAKMLLGYPVRQVAISYHEVSQRGEARAEIVNWCASTLKVPSAMAKMMDAAQRLTKIGSSTQYSTACPVALESVVNLSVLSGYEIVLTTESIRKLSTVPAPETFQLPQGYREIPPPR